MGNPTIGFKANTDCFYHSVFNNAIRFTAEATYRKIVVRLDASERIPTQPEDAIRVYKDQSKPEVEGQQWLAVAIQDSGRGLTASERSNLFQRFSQARSVDGLSGFGLGLFVSKEIIALHQGYIQVASSPGKGATFQFGLPIERSTEAKESYSPVLGLADNSLDSSSKKASRPAFGKRSSSGRKIPNGTSRSIRSANLSRVLIVEVSRVFVPFVSYLIAFDITG